MLLKIWIGPLALVALGLLWVSAPAIAGPIYLTQGQRALAEQDTATAIERLEAARRWQPEEAEVQRQLALAYLKANQPEAALPAAETALRLEPDEPDSHLVLGDVYDALNRPEQAVAHYEAGFTGDRALPLAINYLRLADELWAAGQYDEAAAIWRDKVRLLGYGELYANWRLAGYYRAQGVPSDFEDKLSLYFSPDELDFSAASSRLEPYDAAALVGLVEDGLWTREKLLHMLVYLIGRKPNDAAETVLHRLLAEFPDDAQLHYYLGELLARRGDGPR